MQFASWNVRSTCPSLSDDLWQIDNSGKTVNMNSELVKLDGDIATLQETRLVTEATNLNTIDKKTKKTLYNKSPRAPNFYMLPKIHKPNNPGRPTVNGIGSITEKISAYIDQQIRHLVPRIPSYLKDTTHLIHILLGKKLAPEDILVTIDVQ